jgi:cyanophycin synthetase
MTTTSGIYIGGKCILKGDTTGPKSALAVLTNKEVEAAVLETARGGIIRQGLAYDLADVGVITNITEDHLGIDEVETLEDLGKVKALVGEAVKDDGYVVINGDDRISISILNRFKSNLIVFSRNKENIVMKENIKKGGYGIYVDKDDLIIEKRDCCCNLINIKDIGITMRGILKYNIENAMAACGAAIGIGVDYSVIKRGLQTFYSNEVQNPGRFNIYDVNGITVILDYGHNIEGYKCVLEGVSKLKRNMLIGVVGVPGDRLDSDIIKIGKCASKKFDYIFIKEDEDKRGRKEKEVAKLLKDGILSTGFDEVNLEIVLNEKEAFERAVQFAKPGDIVITFFEKEEPIKEIIKNKVNGNGRKDKLLVKS